MLNSIGERRPPCGTPVLNWRCVDVLFLKVVYALRPLMWFTMDLSMVLGTCVCNSFIVSECKFTVSKALLISRATVSVRARGVY